MKNGEKCGCGGCAREAGEPRPGDRGRRLADDYVGARRRAEDEMEAEERPADDEDVTAFLNAVEAGGEAPSEAIRNIAEVRGIDLSLGAVCATADVEARAILRTALKVVLAAKAGALVDSLGVKAIDRFNGGDGKTVRNGTDEGGGCKFSPTTFLVWPPRQQDACRTSVVGYTATW